MFQEKQEDGDREIAIHLSCGIADYSSMVSGNHASYMYSDPPLDAASSPPCLRFVLEIRRPALLHAPVTLASPLLSANDLVCLESCLLTDLSAVLHLLATSAGQQGCPVLALLRPASLADLVFVWDIQLLQLTLLARISLLGPRLESVGPKQASGTWDVHHDGAWIDLVRFGRLVLLKSVLFAVHVISNRVLDLFLERAEVSVTAPSPGKVIRTRASRMSPTTL